MDTRNTIQTGLDRLKADRERAFHKLARDVASGSMPTEAHAIATLDSAGKTAADLERLVDLNKARDAARLRLRNYPKRLAAATAACDAASARAKELQTALAEAQAEALTAWMNLNSIRGTDGPDYEFLTRTCPDTELVTRMHKAENAATELVAPMIHAEKSKAMYANFRGQFGQMNASPDAGERDLGRAQEKCYREADAQLRDLAAQHAALPDANALRQAVFNA